MQDFRNLKVWQKAHQLVLAIYAMTRALPREETYGMVAQMRRTAMSIPMKIADACGQSGDEEFRRSLWVANAAARELEYQLLLSRDLGYINDEAYNQHQPMIVEVQKMLSGLLNSAGSRSGWKSNAE